MEKASQDRAPLGAGSPAAEAGGTWSRCHQKGKVEGGAACAQGSPSSAALVCLGSGRGGQFQGEVETALRVGEGPGRRGLVCPPRPAPGLGEGAVLAQGTEWLVMMSNGAGRAGRKEALLGGGVSLPWFCPPFGSCLPMKIICSPKAFRTETGEEGGVQSRPPSRVGHRPEGRWASERVFALWANAQQGLPHDTGTGHRCFIVDEKVLHFIAREMAPLEGDVKFKLCKSHRENWYQNPGAFVPTQMLFPEELDKARDFSSC